MAVEPLVLVTNPGSASRKYAVYQHNNELIRVHIEYVDGQLVAHLTSKKVTQSRTLEITQLEQASSVLTQLLTEAKIISDNVVIGAVAIRIVAPSGYFLKDMPIGDYELDRLRELHQIAPLHISATLSEIESIRQHMPNVPIVGISDSAFHATKPDYAWNYAINLEDADTFDLKRFGYHGISLTSIVSQLHDSKYDATGKVIICHLGSGASVTAVLNSMSVDTTMGYSPLEGVVMSTRSGTVEFSAGLALAKFKQISPDELANELNMNAGLRGVSGGVDDIRLLLEKEAQGDYRAGLALSMYVYSVRQAIARMASTLEGVDMLVFTGTVGQRSAQIRKRIVSGLDFLQLALNDRVNMDITEPEKLLPIHPRTRIKPILVIPTQEERTMALHARKMM